MVHPAPSVTGEASNSATPTSSSGASPHAAPGPTIFPASSTVVVASAPTPGAAGLPKKPAPYLDAVKRVESTPARPTIVISARIRTALPDATRALVCYRYV